MVIYHGGITAAADKLGLSKSTVSLQISRLEKRLGVRLLERSSRRVALTREGARLLPRVRSLLEEVRLLVDDSTDAAAIPGGTVRIAVTPALGGVVLEQLIPQMRRNHPNLRLIIEPTYSFEDLQDPSFDFAIRVGRVKDENLVANHLGTFRRILVSAPGLVPQDEQSDLAAISRFPCLVFSGRSSRANWHFERVGMPDKHQTIAIESHISIKSFASLIDMAGQGLGVAYVPEFLAKREISDGKLVHCWPDWQSPAVDVLLAYRVGASKIARVEAALGEAREVVSALLCQYK
ncbi:MAG: LysR family transcriptional regulator [Rhodobacteraceae bacterium]|nr:LysR family transcriptional regulator [Paracoccaceae bacterium]